MLNCNTLFVVDVNILCSVESHLTAYFEKNQLPKIKIIYI